MAPVTRTLEPDTILRGWHMRFEPLGDQAVMAYCDSEQDAAVLAAQVRRANPAWCIDVVQAYFSVAVYYDLTAIDCTVVADWLAQVSQQPGAAAIEGRTHVIPCCYELGLDFERIEKHTALTRDQIIKLHLASV